MPTYATLADLRAYMDLEPDSPFPNGVDDATASRYLRVASGLVGEAIAGAVYHTTDEGLPTDSAKAAACREVTCAQAEAWIITRIDPALGRAQIKRSVKQKSLSGGGASVTYDDADPGLVALAGGRDLLPASFATLAQQGLLTTAVQTSYPGRDVYLTGTEYRLTTGELLP